MNKQDPDVIPAQTSLRKTEEKATVILKICEFPRVSRSDSAFRTSGSVLIVSTVPCYYKHKAISIIYFYFLNLSFKIPRFGV